jgi:MHS family proline/betaine transporter-like MFS transporter
MASADASAALAARTFEESPEKHSPQRLALAGIIGNVLEWYDFSVYGFFAPAIGAHFFPSKKPLDSLIAAFGVFAAGFLMRPLGAILFGHLGDNHGRERALMLSVLAMAVPTCLIGVLPGYQQIGVTASVLMVALRLTQGLSVGGEYTTSIVFLVEQSAPGKRGLMASFGAFGAFGGVLLGSTVGAVVTSVLSPQAAFAWGWRVPFLLGISLGAAGYFLRRELQGVAAAPTQSRAPLMSVLRQYWATILQVIGFKMLCAVGFYLVFVYLTTYLADVVHIAKSRALEIDSISMAMVLIIIPWAASLSDRIGRKPLLVTSALVGAVLFWPLFHMLQHPILAKPLIAQLGFALIIGFFMGVEPAASAEAFPASVRCTGTAISHNVGMAVFGGTAPMVATYLIMRTRHDMSPAWYLVAAAVISAVCAMTLNETAKLPLSD